MPLPIVVYLPEPNAHSGGGSLMHALCGMLNRVAGRRVAYSTPGRVDGHDRMPTPDRVLAHIADCPADAAPLALVQSRRFVALYPEVTRENPLRAAVVLRWVLLVPPPDVHTTWRPTDVLVGFLPVYLALYNRWWKTALRPRLDLFLAFGSYPFRDRSDGRPRRGVVYTCRKAYATFRRDPLRRDLTPMFDPIGAYRIEPGRDLPPAAIERLMSERERFVSYDPFTFFSVIAALCGCVSIVEPIPGVPLDEYRRLGGPLVQHGIAYGDTPDQLAHAAATQHLVADDVARVTAGNDDRLWEFINGVEQLTA